MVTGGAVRFIIQSMHGYAILSTTVPMSPGSTATSHTATLSGASGISCARKHGKCFFTFCVSCFLEIRFYEKPLFLQNNLYSVEVTELQKLKVVKQLKYCYIFNRIML